jgi:hypothetical protein
MEQRVLRDIPTCSLAISPNHFCGRCALSSSGVSAVALHSTCVGLNISLLPSRNLSMLEVMECDARVRYVELERREVTWPRSLDHMATTLNIFERQAPRNNIEPNSKVETNTFENESSVLGEESLSRNYQRLEKPRRNTECASNSLTRPNQKDSLKHEQDVIESIAKFYSTASSDRLRPSWAHCANTLRPFPPAKSALTHRRRGRLGYTLEPCDQTTSRSLESSWRISTWSRQLGFG